ncbi:MAG: AAA family ATPase, partial [Phycisphaerae bacterium]
MKRRLNIGGALLHEPDLLLMDEPTAGVDPQARAYIFEIVERLAADGRGVLYTTHYMEEAQRLCRRTAIIDHGRILAAGTLEELTRHVRSRRCLVIEAEGLTEASLVLLSEKLGQVDWTLENGAARLAIGDAGPSLLDAVRATDAVGLRPTAIRIQEPDLQAVFLELTGRELRD